MLVPSSFGKSLGTTLGLVTMLTARPPPPNVAGLQRSRQTKKCVTERPRQREEVASLFYLWECSKAVYKGVLLQDCFCSIILLSDRCWDSGWGRATLTPLHDNVWKSIQPSNIFFNYIFLPPPIIVNKGQQDISLNDFCFALYCRPLSNPINRIYKTVLMPYFSKGFLLRSFSCHAINRHTILCYNILIILPLNITNKKKNCDWSQSMSVRELFLSTAHLF